MVGGNERVLEAGAQIGFPWDYSTESSHIVGAYLNRLGLPPSAVNYITYMWWAAADQSWLTLSDAKALGIEVTDTPVGIDYPSAVRGTSIKINEESSSVHIKSLLAKTEEDARLRVAGWTQEQIDNMSSAVRQRELQAINSMSSAVPQRELQAINTPTTREVQSETSQRSGEQDGRHALWVIGSLLAFFLFDKWKKKRAANKAAEAEKEAQREQAWQDYERREQQRWQKRAAEAEKEAQREQAQQDHERREQQRRREQAAETNKDRTRHWWDVLGVSRSASMDEIKRAYHSKLRMYHPDRVNGLGPEFIRMAEDRTRELNSAFEQAKRATV